MSDPFSQVYDDDTRIRNRMGVARARMQLQLLADDLKRQLTDKIAAERNAKSALAARINALQNSDAELYEYIRDLERINASIWCSNCESVKNVPGLHEQKPAPAPKRIADDKVKELSGQLDLLARHAADLHKEFTQRVENTLAVMVELSQKIEELRPQLHGSAAPQPTIARTYTSLGATSVDYKSVSVDDALGPLD